MKKIEIMGCGYIGLPTAITFTLAGFEVCGFDVKQEVVDQLNGGKIHIVEPGLQDALTKALETGRLHFVTKPEPADVFIIAVQTGRPLRAGVDLAALLDAAGGVDCGRSERDG